MASVSRNFVRKICHSAVRKQFPSTLHYIPRRAVLYVPGNDERKLQKIPTLHADCIVMDCEDGVALSRKDEARKIIHNVLDSGNIDFTGKDISVRFNSLESGFCELDMAEILSANCLPMTVHLPKVENADHVKWFSDKITNNLKHRKLTQKLRLILFAESAKAFLNLPNICEMSINCSKVSPFHLDALVFGSDDFCADIGATRTAEAQELLYARQYLVMVAKAYRLQAIDLVHIDYKDLVGLKRQSDEGALMGFTGKQVIHPCQIEIVQSSFSPGVEKVQWAQQLLEAYETHQKDGKGAFAFRGHMIDMPLVLQAKNVLDTAKKFSN